MLSFLLVPLYTNEKVLPSPAEYGEVSVIFSYFVLFNVILAYGMETAFFRFFNKSDDKDSVIGTSAISLILSSIVFLILGLSFTSHIANYINIDLQYVKLVVWILLLDALVIIPFAWLRANQQPTRYAVIKILNVVINLGLNVFFLLYLKHMASDYSILETIYKPNYQINYIFIANLIASAVTLVLMLPFYIKVKFKFNVRLWKQMMVYAFPILIAGLAFSINETFDRILLDRLLPKAIASSQIGMYAACYKLAVFMTLFVTAYKLGIEPFFFSHAKTRNPQKAYAKILELFVALGAIILMSVVVFADVLKPFIIQSEAYWEAMWIVPVILIANFCLGIYHNLSVWYKITDRTKYGAYISVFGAIITLIINIMFIKTYGYKASAIATLAAYATMMMISYFYGRKYYPIPYNMKKIVFYLVTSIAASLGLFYSRFRADYIVGVSVLVVFLTIVFLMEKNEIKQLMKNDN